MEGWIDTDKSDVAEYVAGIELIKAYALMINRVDWATICAKNLKEEFLYLSLMPWRYGFAIPDELL